jgi:glycosyl transferase, family 25
MHALEYFNKIYVINLLHRRDRRREMLEQLSKIGLSFDCPVVQLFRAVRPESADGFPSIGARGCFLSHLEVLRDACKRGFERILILEDDLNFAPNFNVRMWDVRSALEQVDWSVFYGGYVMKTPLQRDGNNTIVLANPGDLIQTTHFVGFRGQTICNAVGFLEAILKRPAGDPNGGPMHVDGAYNWLRDEYSSRITVLAGSQLGYQRSSRTDIHPLCWYDRIPGVRQAVGSLRMLGNRR